MLWVDFLANLGHATMKEGEITLILDMVIHKQHSQDLILIKAVPINLDIPRHMLLAHHHNLLQLKIKGPPLKI